MARVAVCLLLALAAFAQKKPITLATVDEMAQRERPGAPVWAPDGNSFVFRQGRNLMLYRIASKSAKTLVALDDLDAVAVKPPAGDGPYDWTNRRARTGDLQWSVDGKTLLTVEGGDIFLIHAETGKWDQLTSTAAVEIDPQLSPDGSRVAFRRGWDLFTLEVASRKETQLTSGGSATLRNGALDWVYPEEIGLSTAFWWSPDSRWLAYLQFDTSREPMFPHEDLRGLRAVFEPEPYPQAGENNASVHLGIVPARGGKTRWLETPGARDWQLVARAGWMPNGHSIYLVRTNREQNRLEALAIEIDSGKASRIFHESDKYWINIKSDLQFLRDGKRFLWTSERDGHAHLYLYTNDGKDVKQLTRGNWEVTGVPGVDEGGGRVFYTSSEGSHLERRLWSVGVDGQDKHAVTEEPGTHTISMAPTGGAFLDTYSNLTAPPRTVLRAADGRELAVYREADRIYEEYEVLPTEIVQFRGPDGTLLGGRVIKPAGFQAGVKYPVIVSVYGGPDVALPVRNAWYGVNVDQVLAHRGYVIWEAENRGGMGRGHAFEAPVFHRLGTTELADQVAGVQYLISLGFADPQRVGIRGWSYGGFMTVNALLNAPDVFRAGFAGAPVTNWRNYDTIYTERYMGLPEENPDGYQATALAQYAAKLRGKLMLVHNLEDDNVLFQNTLQLTDALQSAGKQFELMVYPQKTHAVTGAATDHLNEMMIEFFDRCLKAGN
ncbi:MAG TPA: DPP IV N-terminal domain-containing protein [Bryobacteraceae bacterium]|jgi:dipeptidyl-peptidase-4|nr:DPP IV N-terminal domain-containing protein [Bryobacteraceae bacterium]